MKPICYDFPQRFRGLASGQREISRLARSTSAAEIRGDRRAVAYLLRRLNRARNAYGALRSHLAAMEAASAENTR